MKALDYQFSCTPKSKYNKIIDVDLITRFCRPITDKLINLFFGNGNLQIVTIVFNN